jgi:hypothetical protein
VTSPRTVHISVVKKSAAAIALQCAARNVLDPAVAHVGFSRAIRMVSWRISRITPGRPTGSSLSGPFTCDELPMPPLIRPQNQPAGLRSRIGEAQSPPTLNDAITGVYVLASAFSASATVIINVNGSRGEDVKPERS